METPLCQRPRLWIFILKTMEKLKHSEFIARLSVGGAHFVGLKATIDARANKPFKGITKTVRTVGLVGANYESAVIREGDRQGADASRFVADSRPWGEWLIPNKIATHKGEFYLRTQSTPGQRRKQAARVLCYRDETGRYVSKADIAPFLPAPSLSSKQSDAGLSDSPANQIWVREYKLSNVERVRIGGRTFDLVPD